MESPHKTWKHNMRVSFLLIQIAYFKIHTGLAWIKSLFDGYLKNSIYRSIFTLVKQNPKISKNQSNAH